jgi:hypothetical protein
MPDIVVSAHGGRWKAQEANLEIPKGSEVYFYVKDGGILDNNTGHAILANLKSNNAPGGKVAQTVFEGGRTYDYFCWYAQEFAAYCGIYAVGSPNRIQDLSQYTKANHLLLSAILKHYPNCKVYWDCCRDISTPAEGFPLQDSQDAFPGPPPS